MFQLEERLAVWSRNGEGILRSVHGSIGKKLENRGRYLMSSSHLHDDDVTSQAIAEWLKAFNEDDLLREEIVFCCLHSSPSSLCSSTSGSISRSSY